MQRGVPCCVTKTASSTLEKKKAARLARDEAFNKAALTWSIFAAVVVFIGLITMMIMASMR